MVCIITDLVAWSFKVLLPLNYTCKSQRRYGSAIWRREQQMAIQNTTTGDLQLWITWRVEHDKQVPLANKKILCAWLLKEESWLTMGSALLVLCLLIGIVFSNAQDWTSDYDVFTSQQVCWYFFWIQNRKKSGKWIKQGFLNEAWEFFNINAIF